MILPSSHSSSGNQSAARNEGGPAELQGAESYVALSIGGQFEMPITIKKEIKNMTKVISIANQKGGVGKTSTTVNLGAGLQKLGFDVLLIDLDAQGNLTMSLGFQDPDNLSYSITDALEKAVKEENIDPSEGILSTDEGIDLMPANISLSEFEVRLINEYGREAMLKQFIDSVKMNYDFILIDCAPSLNIMTINALVASDSVLIPTQPQYFSTAGLQMLFQTINKVQHKMNPELQIEGVLVTMMDKRPKFTRELVSLIREAYGSSVHVFDTEIPTSIRMTESGANGQSIFQYDPKGKVAEAYENLAKEVVANGRERQTVRSTTRTFETIR